MGSDSKPAPQQTYSRVEDDLRGTPGMQWADYYGNLWSVWFRAAFAESMLFEAKWRRGQLQLQLQEAIRIGDWKVVVAQRPSLLSL